MKKNIFIAGHNGMAGSALFNLLNKKKHINLLTASRSNLDLMDISQVKKFFDSNKIDEVYLAAAQVGGILANSTYPADFIFNNLTIQNNVIHQAYLNGVKKLLFLGSSCIYPKFAKQPISENQLLAGPLEMSNEPYALAKISGISLCKSLNQQYGLDYRCVMPTNLYGFNDNFHENNSHVIPGLIRRFSDAKKDKISQVTVWGSGNPQREFLFVNDFAEACYFVMGLDKDIFYSSLPTSYPHINVGSGHEISIKNLVKLIAEIIGYKGEIYFDKSKPDGTPRKLLDSSAIVNLGWNPKIDLEQGLELTYEWFQQENTNLRL